MDNRNKNFSTYRYQSILCLTLIIHSVVYFSRALVSDWLPGGDTANQTIQFSYQFSSFARGEFPFWAPILMAGETTDIYQAIVLGGPIANLVIFISILFGMSNIVLCHAIYQYILVILYVLGTYLLIDSWTNNRAASCFAALVALFSSTVFFISFQNGFLMIVHAVPWVLYSLIKYFQKYEFKYVLCFILAICNSLYSYEFVMVLSYLLFFSLTTLIFYYKKFNKNFLNNIPLNHVGILIIFLIISVLPQILIYLDLKSGPLLMSTSRMADLGSYNVNNQYSIDYQLNIERQTENFITGENNWLALFFGTYVKPNDRSLQETWSAIKYYIGPVTLPFIFVSLLSLNRRSWCVFAAGLFVSFLAADIFPFNLIFNLPIFQLIRNAYFLNHFLLFTFIILSALGLDILSKKPSTRVQRTFILTSLILLTTCLTAHIFLPRFLEGRGSYVPGSYNNIALFIASISLTIILFSYFFKRRSFLVWELSIIILAMLVGFSENYLILKNNENLKGIVVADPNLAALKNRTDHSLKFRFKRPSEMEMVDILSFAAAGHTHSSFATLRDNSYNHPIENGGFPTPKSFSVFRSIPGNELYLANKFFFFSQVFISESKTDMGVFVERPDLLKKFFNKNIGIADSVEGVVNLGKIDLTKLETILDVPQQTNFNVEVQSYNANSMRFKVTSDIRGLFVYTDLWHKDWNVEVNGNRKPLRKIFHTFKGVELEPGVNEVRFIFRSKIGYSLIATNLIFAILLIVLTLSIFQKKKLYPNTTYKF